MKKKLIALTLCLLLCLPLVLASCSNNKNNEEPPKTNDEQTTPKSPELSIYELLGGKFESNEGFSDYSKFDIEGRYVDGNEFYFVTVEEDVSIDLVSTSTYRVYNLITGAMIYSTSVVFDAKNLSYVTDCTNVEFDYAEDYLVVYKTFGGDMEDTSELFAPNGQLLISKEGEVDFYTSSSLDRDKDFISVEGEIYEIKKDDNGYVAEMVSNGEFSQSSFMVYTITKAGDSFIAVNRDQNMIAVLDSQFNVVNYFYIFDTQIILQKYLA